MALLLGPVRPAATSRLVPLRVCSLSALPLLVRLGDNCLAVVLRQVCTSTTFAVQWPSGSRRVRKSCPLTVPKPSAKNAVDSRVAKVGLPSNVETAVKDAGATAKHCIVLHGQSAFSVDIRTGQTSTKNVTPEPMLPSARPRTSHWSRVHLTCMVWKAPHKSLQPPGACTLHTSNTTQGVAHVVDTFHAGPPNIQAETAAFLQATEPHSLWEGPTLLCLADDGKMRRLRLVLTKESCLSKGKQNQFQSHSHPLHGSGLLWVMRQLGWPKVMQPMFPARPCLRASSHRPTVPKVRKTL